MTVAICILLSAFLLVFYRDQQRQSQRELCDVVQIFSAEYPEMLRNIEEAIKQGDAAGLRRSSHKLKGALLQLAAPRAMAAVADLEYSATNVSSGNLELLVNKVKAEVDSLMPLLKEMIARTMPDQGNRAERG